jgi:cell division protein FtsQ
MKRILHIVFYILLTGGLAFLMGFIDNKNGELQIRQIDVSITRHTDTELLTREDIMDLIGNKNNALINKPFSVINIEQIESLTTAHQYVENANVYWTFPGVLHIDIVQRVPLVRIINEKLQHFYISADGSLMSLHPGITPKILVASGSIRDSLNWSVRCKNISHLELDSIPDHLMLSAIFSLARLIQADKFLEAQTEQIFINEHHEIELVPKIGNQLILLGNSNRMEEKLRKLKAFYTEGIRYNGWETYQSINLKYRNQIVCTKY